MEIEFIMRDPGNHKALPIKTLDCCPREGELVTLDGDVSYYVHQVTHDVSRGVVSILLRV